MPTSEHVDADSEDLPKDLQSVSPSHRRAIWIVVLRNVGYACMEIGASFTGRSEALNADALDFFGAGAMRL